MILTTIINFYSMSKILKTVPEDRGLLNFGKVLAFDFCDFFYLSKGWAERSFPMIALLRFKSVILLVLATNS